MKPAHNKALLEQRHCDQYHAQAFYPRSPETAAPGGPPICMSAGGFAGELVVEPFSLQEGVVEIVAQRLYRVLARVRARLREYPYCLVSLP